MLSRVIVLSLGTFAIGTDGFVIAGILPALAGDLAVPMSTAGTLVTAFAITYAISSPLLAAATSTLARHRLLVASLALFAAANAAAALAPSLGWLFLARGIAALAAALYTPTASTAAALLAPPEQRGRALALVMAGLTAATVLGVPLGTWIGTAFGWRATFWLVTGIGVMAAIGVLWYVPRIPNPPAVGWRDRLAVLRQPPIAVALTLTILWTIGGFTVYTFIASVLHDVTHLDGTATSGMLLLLGLASVLGNQLGGHGADRWGPVRTIAMGLGVLALVLLSLSWTATTPLGASVAIGVWGIAAWMVTPAQQHRLLALAPGLPGVILSLNGSAIYLGIGSGAALGGWVLQAAPPAMLGWVGGACELLALGLLWLSAGLTAQRTTSNARS